MAKKLGGLGKGLNAIFMENNTENKNSTIMIRLSDIEPNVNQPRYEFNEKALEELAESIATHGVLQPMLVRPIIGGGYEIVAGERRYRASKMAGLIEVPVVVREMSDKESMELALIENLQRENLTPMEEAKGYRALIETHGFSQDDIAKSLGKSRPTISNALRLLKLPEEIKILLDKQEITTGHARALLALDSAEDIIKISKEIIDNELSVRQVENIIKEVKKIKESKSEEHTSIENLKPEKNKYYSEVELALTEYLGKKVKVVPAQNKEGGVLYIEFYSEQDLSELANKLDDKGDL